MEFWDLNLREVNLIIEGHEKDQENKDVRMRRGWFIQYRVAGVKNVKESALWPMAMDERKIQEVKRRNIENYDKIKEFANLQGKPKEK